MLRERAIAVENGFEGGDFVKDVFIYKIRNFLLAGGVLLQRVMNI